MPGTGPDVDDALDRGRRGAPIEAVGVRVEAHQQRSAAAGDDALGRRGQGNGEERP
jgi:hypothetical protein